MTNGSKDPTLSTTITISGIRKAKRSRIAMKEKSLVSFIAWNT